MGERAPRRVRAAQRAQILRRRWAAAGILAAACVYCAATFAHQGAFRKAPGVRHHLARVQHHVVARQARTHRPHETLLHLPAALPVRVLRLPILMYHRIDRETPRLSSTTRTLTVTPSAFKAQMEWLAQHGYHAIRQEQLFAALYAHASLPPKPVLLTFDDGYRDVFKNALPVLARLHLAATAYVVTGRISGSDPSFLTWGELGIAEREGLEIGSHTVTHRPLPQLPPATAERELLDSRRTLERHLGHAVQWFAYPYGSVNAQTIAEVHAAGYVLAVTTQGGTLQDARHPYELHRYEVRADESLADFAATLAAT
jgi:peptidoglycan/xylan/chitin deacetylase (PgdA/CDA1 family)